MPPAESFPSKLEAVDAAIAEVRRALLAKVFVCVRLVGGRGRVNVTEFIRDRKVVKRFRWTSGEAA
jgi:hypothetical protein